MSAVSAVTRVASAPVAAVTVNGHTNFSVATVADGRVIDPNNIPQWLELAGVEPDLSMRIVNSLNWQKIAIIVVEKNVWRYLFQNPPSSLRLRYEKACARCCIQGAIEVV